MIIVISVLYCAYPNDVLSRLICFLPYYFSINKLRLKYVLAIIFRRGNVMMYVYQPSANSFLFTCIAREYIS